MSAPGAGRTNTAKRAAAAKRAASAKKPAGKGRPDAAKAQAKGKPAAEARAAAKAKGAARSKAPAKGGSVARAKPTDRPRPAKGARKPCLVVGYDGSAGARAAASWAADVLPADGRIVLVHSVRPLHAPASPLASAAERRRLGRAVIDELMLEAPRRLLERDVAAEISDRDPVSALTTAARRHGASGIVVGCQSHSRLRKALGTVTSELLKSSTVPVTAVPHRT